MKRKSRFLCRIRSVDVVCTTKKERTRVVERRGERVEGMCESCEQEERRLNE